MGWGVGYGAGDANDEDGNIAIVGRGWISVREAWEGLQSGSIKPEQVEDVCINVPGEGSYGLEDYVNKHGVKPPTG